MENVSRRKLLLGMAATVAFRNDTLAAISKITYDAHPSPTDEAYWSHFRGAFFLPQNLICFNHVGVNPPPRAVEDAQARESRRAAADPSYYEWQQQDQELDSVRADLAAMIGFSPDEVALVPNATYGLHTTILGLQLAPGQEIMLSSQENGRTVTAVEQRERRDGIRSSMVDLDGKHWPQGEIQSRFVSQLRPETKLVIASEVTYLLGQRIPVAEIAQDVQSRGALMLADGAHSIGLLPQTGKPAIYAASLHKWMMGPVGTGVFAVRTHLIPRIWPLHAADASLDDKIHRFEQRGTHATAPFLALKESIELHHRLGYETKLGRLLHLRTQISSKLEGTPGLEFLSSLDPDVCVPFLTLSLRGWDPNAAMQELLDHDRIHVTTANREGVRGIRISPNLFTSQGEVDALVAALRRMAANPPSRT